LREASEGGEMKMKRGFNEAWFFLINLTPYTRKSVGRSSVGQFFREFEVRKKRGGDNTRRERERRERNET
jgi:hypothetical protein